jgi:hypothetical protein
MDNSQAAVHLISLIENNQDAQFLHFARRFILDNVERYWFSFKDVLYPVVQCLYLLMGQEPTAEVKRVPETSLIA